MNRSLEDILRHAIRAIPDYPKPGIIFRDITTMLGDARAFRRALRRQRLNSPYLLNWPMALRCWATM